MADAIHALVLTDPVVQPPASPPAPTPSNDPFGPAVVIGPSAPPPQFVVYDSQGRLTTSIPPQPTDPTLPPAQIATDPGPLPPSLLYFS
jgi:hypothetical protein